MITLINEDADDLLELDEDQVNSKSGAIFALSVITILLWFCDAGMSIWCYWITCSCLFNSVLRSSWVSDYQLPWWMRKMYKNWGRSFAERRNMEFIVHDLDALLNVTSSGDDSPARPTVTMQNSLYQYGKACWNFSFYLYEPYYNLDYNLDYIIRNYAWTKPEEVKFFYKFMLESCDEKNTYGLDVLYNKPKYTYSVKFSNKYDFNQYLRKLNLTRHEYSRLTNIFRSEKKIRKNYMREVIKTGLYGISPVTFKQVKKLYLSKKI